MQLCNLLEKKLLIGDYFLKHGFLSQEQINTILLSQDMISIKNGKQSFGQIAMSLGFITENELLVVLSDIFQFKIVDLASITIYKENADLLEYSYSKRNIAVAFFSDQNQIKVAINDPSNLKMLDEISRKFLDKKTHFYLAEKKQIERLISIYSRQHFDELDAVSFLNNLIHLAIERNASDVHLYPKENNINVRIRVDGVLEHVDYINYKNWRSIASRIKVLADLNITESRLPQSGHANLSVNGHKLDLRVSTHPSNFGECIAIRILDGKNSRKQILDLGFLHKDEIFLKNIIRNTTGIFLVVGPTGAGKTTTLYSILNELDKNSLNIMTLEDPIEYQIDGIQQLNLDDENFISFADGIKSILRQDPDVLLVGEIRDENTAASVIRASLTGRLVLATLHAPTPIDAIRRLLDLNVDISEISSQILGIFTQRLVRRKVDNVYRGRIPVCEYIKFNKNTQTQVLTDYTKIELDSSFEQSIQNLLAYGITDEAEIERVFGIHI